MPHQMIRLRKHLGRSRLESSNGLELLNCPCIWILEKHPARLQTSSCSRQPALAFASTTDLVYIWSCCDSCLLWHQGPQ